MLVPDNNPLPPVFNEFTKIKTSIGETNPSLLTSKALVKFVLPSPPLDPLPPAVETIKIESDA